MRTLNLTRDTRVSDNGSLTDAIKRQLVEPLNFHEKTNNDFEPLHALLGTFKFLRSLASGEASDARKVVSERLKAEGLDDVQVKANAEYKAIQRQRDVSILRRLLAPAGTDDKIYLTVKMESKLTSLLKKAVGYSDYVSAADLDDALLLLTETIASKATSVTIDDLTTAIQSAKDELSASKSVAV